MNVTATIAIVLAAGTLLLPPAGAGAAFAFDDDAAVGPAFAHPLWAPMARRHDAERAGIDACVADARACAAHLRDWRALLMDAAGFAPREQLQHVDAFFDALERDAPAPAVWHTLGDVLRHGGSDADIAIAKYYTLRRLGFASDALRVVVIEDPESGMTRTVLAVRLDGEAHTLHGAPAAPERTVRRYAINELFWWDDALFGRASREPTSL